MITSDLHLGHKNIAKYRTEFPDAETHHETIFENLATSINKRDSVIFLGDIAFTKDWLYRLNQIKCQKKTLILGNHDTEKVHIRDIVNVYDDVHSLWSKRNCLWSHAPIHPQELRGHKVNIHGHLHGNMVWKNWERQVGIGSFDELDQRYINVCVEHTDWRPVSYADLNIR